MNDEVSVQEHDGQTRRGWRKDYRRSPYERGVGIAPKIWGWAGARREAAPELVGSVCVWETFGAVANGSTLKVCISSRPSSGWGHLEEVVLGFEPSRSTPLALLRDARQSTIRNGLAGGQDCVMARNPGGGRILSIWTILSLHHLHIEVVKRHTLPNKVQHFGLRSMSRETVMDLQSLRNPLSTQKLLI